MAPQSSTLAWKIPWTEEPGRLQSMGLQRVGHDWATSFTFHFHALGKDMAAHSSVLAWRIPGMGGPGGPPSMGSHRVGHDWSNLAAAAAAAAADIPFSRGLKDWTCVSCIAGRFFTIWATREAQFCGYVQQTYVYQNNEFPTGQDNVNDLNLIQWGNQI